MITAGAAFIVGAFLMAFAQNLPMLVIGRAFLGWGVGFANQSAPLYLSEMAPAQLRGALNIGFQMATTLGILVAGLINYGKPFIASMLRLLALLPGNFHFSPCRGPSWFWWHALDSISPLICCLTKSTALRF